MTSTSQTGTKLKPFSISENLNFINKVDRFLNVPPTKNWETNQDTYILTCFVGVVLLPVHVKWVPCYHGMARPRVADRGDSLQIQRVAANMLNEQSRTADRGWPSRLGGGANNPPHRKKLYLLQSMYKGLGSGQILWHEQSTGKRIRDLARGMSGASIGQAH
jgi:hypothetical protein